MSGDWIKMRVDLRTHPKVVRMASALKADKLRVIGGLFAVWSIFDAHSSDGILEGYTHRSIDDELAWKGFAQSMADVGWLEDHGEGMQAPRFDEHNGQSAKRRATETERKRAERKADKVRTESGQASASGADKLRSREEKRREEIEKPPKPPAQPSASLHRFPPGFETLWSEYPRKVGKDAAAKAFAKRKPDEALLAAMVRAVKAQRSSPQWAKDGGQFIPHLSTWLNEGRWQDEAGPSSPANDIFAGAM